MVTLRDVLSAPFILRSESVELDEETWVRVVSYPELGCLEEGLSIPEVMERLEAQKLRLLLDRYLAGTLPRLRPPILDPTVELRLARAGLQSWIPRLGEEVLQLAGSDSTQTPGPGSQAEMHNRSEEAPVGTSTGDDTDRQRGAGT